MAILNKTESGLTKPMLDRWNPAEAIFEKQVLATSSLATGATNQVVLWAVSKATLGMTDYASTTLYFAKDGYEGCKDGDHDNFINVWEYPGDKLKDITKTVAVRIVIAVNLTLNKTAEEICTTLLHEWFVHAAQWTGVIKSIREGEANKALLWVQSQGYQKRQAGEHKEFANWTDDYMAARVKELGLGDDSQAKVYALLKADRDRYDKTTGEVK
ncbi:MAG TPA: hypothetical protein VJ761_18070 [Ktedonobacteraceae bacterium]|nr:hypothetical protein [Ktedonobacteraceae bacterium]